MSTGSHVARVKGLRAIAVQLQLHSIDLPDFPFDHHAYRSDITPEITA